MKKFVTFLKEEANKPKEIVAYGSIGSRHDIDYPEENTSTKPLTGYGSIGHRPDVSSNTEHITAYGSIGHHPDVADKGPPNEIQVTSSGIKFHLKEQYNPSVTGSDLLQDMNTRNFRKGTNFLPPKIASRPHHLVYTQQAKEAVGHHHVLNHETMWEGGVGGKDSEILGMHFEDKKGIKDVMPHPTIPPKKDPRFGPSGDGGDVDAAEHLHKMRKIDPAKYKGYTSRTDKHIKLGEGAADYTEESVDTNQYLFEHHKHPQFMTPKHMQKHLGKHRAISTKETIEAMDHITRDKRNAAKKNFTVFSGLNHTIGEKIRQTKEGGIVHFPAFTSSSSDFHAAHAFGASKADDTQDVEYQQGNMGGAGQKYKPSKFRKELHAHVAVFHLPKGFAKGRYIDGHSNYSHEKEYVLARNLRFKKVKSEHIVHDRIKGDPDIGEDQIEAHTHVHHFVPV